MPHPSHRPDLINLIIFSEAYTLRSSSLCSVLQPPATVSLLVPNILLSALFSDTLNLCLSLGVRNQFSHPHRTTVKIVVSYILIFFKFEEETRKHKKLKRKEI
jgi:hypothetical protein